MLSRLRQHVLRVFGGPELRPIDAAVLFLFLQVFFTPVYAVLVHTTLHRPDVPLNQVASLRHAWIIQTRIVIPVNVVLFLAALLARRWSPNNRWLAHLALQFTMLVGLWGAYLQGLYTHIFGMSVFLALPMLSLALFEVSIVRPAVITFILGALAITVAEQLDLLPYAPVFPNSPVQDGHLSTRFLLMTGVLPMFMAVTSVLLLLDVTQRLRRATALIRRYVPVQLAERILAGEHAAAGCPERRRLTLFFSDVVGFTAAADQMEPEDLAALLNEYLSEMTRVAEGFGATINQFVGDGIMIFFGAPDATNDRDHALRAVRMATAMQQRMSELGKKWFANGIQAPFRIRIGINTGTASVGDFGSDGRITYSAIGNQTNLAARIQAACEPGKVLISHTTWALVKDQIPCQERGEIRVEGLHYPVRVYEVAWKPSLARSDA
jgi:class 3 adenylate cyclase